MDNSAGGYTRESGHKEQVPHQHHRRLNNRGRVYVFLSAILISTLVGSAVVFVKLRTIRQEETDNIDVKSHTNRPRRFADGGDDLDDLLINANAKTCNEPWCSVCRTEVIPNFEPTPCERHENIKNASCFLCKQKCYTFQQLLGDQGQRLRCPRPVKIDCCILSVMGNLNDYCGPGGRASCYHHKVHSVYKQPVYQPICHCPAWSQSRKCQPPYTETARCRCFKSERKICGQEHISQCSHIKSGWTQCHMRVEGDEENYNCLCNKSEGEIDIKLSQCPGPDKGVDNSWHRKVK